jgi:hypothetical protein
MEKNYCTCLSGKTICDCKQESGTPSSNSIMEKKPEQTFSQFMDNVLPKYKNEADELTHLKAENQNLINEIHQLRTMINNLLGWKTYAK